MGEHDSPQGAPLKLFVKRPGTTCACCVFVITVLMSCAAASQMPVKLPTGVWATPRLKKDIHALAKKYCIEEDPGARMDP